MERNKKLNGKLWERLLVIISALVISGLIVTLVGLPYGRYTPVDYNLTDTCALNHTIQSDVITDFGIYSPDILDYIPAIIPTTIHSYLSNVDLQDQYLSYAMKETLTKYGFALEKSEFNDIFEAYSSQHSSARFVTTDVCLHAYHVFFDMSLRVLEGMMFFEDFELLLYGLCEEQISMRTTVSEQVVITALEKNIAYLSVMLKLLDESYITPSFVESMVAEELQKIDNEERSLSAIFDYEEDYSQYKVRGHYTRNDVLSKYFKAMMFAGRMGFMCKAVPNNPAMEVDHTRRALLLVSCFNATYQSVNMWNYWDRVYQPTAFYVGKSDDLTPSDYYSILRGHSYPTGDALASETLVQEIIEELEAFRNPRINSMLAVFSATSGFPKSFRLMGQRFIPDSYIHQNLAEPFVPDRFMVKGLDVFSVLGSERAALYLEEEASLYRNYTSQINALRVEFSNLSDFDWVQNLYWSWLYTLFPLLETQETEGYPEFMTTEAWQDKSLLTAMGSWAELRHDTILYAKQSYATIGGAGKAKNGYIEPYPELYSRLASMTRMTKEGLENRGTTLTLLVERLDKLIEIFDELVILSIKELENEPLTEADMEFIHNVGERLGKLCDFRETEYEEYADEDEMGLAMIADVFTNQNFNPKVLEVGIGKPYIIYVIVQDEQGNLRLTKGATFSYYEFIQPLSQRLNDEEWKEMLETNPPDILEWIENSLPFVEINSIYLLTTDAKK